MEQIQDPAGAVGHLIDRIGARELMRLYATPHFSSAAEFLVLLAQQRGKLKKVGGVWRAKWLWLVHSVFTKSARHCFPLAFLPGQGGVPDVELVARTVLQDWNGGKIPYCTEPPAETRLLDAAVVTDYATEFSLDNAFEQAEALELQRLEQAAKQDAASFVSLKSGASLKVDLKGLNGEGEAMSEDSNDEYDFGALSADEEEEDEEDAMDDDNDNEEDDDEFDDDEDDEFDEDEGDDDDDDDDDEEEEEEDEEDVPPPPPKKGAATAAGKKSAASAAPVKRSPEDTLNPQLNRQRKRQLQQAQRKRQRQLSRSAEYADDSDEDDGAF